MLTIELHSHTHASGDCLMRAGDIVRTCQRQGIDRLAVTDHNTLRGALELRGLAPELVIVGEEIMTPQGELLAYFLKEEIPPGLSPAETIARLRAQAAAISVSHPFDRLRQGAWREADLAAILPLVDAIEVFNARCIYPEDNARALAFAREHAKLGTVGSDAHSHRELGRAAELARAGRTRGVLLDVEQYEGRLFDFGAQPLSSAYGWDAYAAQARLRGREVMTALQDGYPGLAVFLTFGHSLPFVLSDGGRRPLAETSYGLLAPFLDGVVEAAHGPTQVIDGYELSYGFREPSQFAEAWRLVREGVLPIVGPREAYRKRLRLAFGLWLDYDWRRQGWSATDPERNYFTPAAFETAVRAALRQSDEYVWLYGETPRWWDPATLAARVPEAYVAAIKRASSAVRHVRD